MPCEPTQVLRNRFKVWDEPDPGTLDLLKKTWESEGVAAPILLKAMFATDRAELDRYVWVT